MAELKTAKYIKELPMRKTHHPEILGPIPTLTQEEPFGNMGYTTYWEAITKPFVHADKPHAHDFEQFLFFLGLDPMHLDVLDAEIEINLSLDGKNLDKYMIKKATCVHIPAGLYHNPLIYHKVNKPFMFIDLYFSGDKQYARK
jgi:hypothetical protein